MNTVEPIRDTRKILAIKANLKAQDKPRDYLLFTLGINLAMRISDLLSLRVKDLLSTGGDVRNYLYVTEQKTKRQRKIKLNISAKEALNYYLKNTVIVNPDDFLFTSKRSGKPLERVRAWQLVQSWCSEAGLKSERYGTHTLRKTWGYLARQKGISIELIQEKLGHRSSAVTRRYIGITQEEVNGVEDRVCL